MKRKPHSNKGSSADETAVLSADIKWAEKALMDLLSVNSPSGDEMAVSKAIRSILSGIDISGKMVSDDQCNKIICFPY